MFVYSLGVLASGLFRYFSREGGEKGLWFGVVMGAIGLLSAKLLASGRRTPGLVVSALTLVFVGGWFFYEVLILKGLNQAESRQILVLGASIGVAFAMARHPDNRRS